MIDLTHWPLHRIAMYSLSLDASSLQILLAVVGFLLLCSIFRIIQVARDNRRMSREIDRLERAESEQRQEVETRLREAESWREGMRRHLDTLRTDFNARLQQSEAGNLRVQQQLDSLLEEMLKAPQTRKLNTEKPRQTHPTQVTPPSITPAAPTLPALPALETLRLQALESDLNSARAEIASLRQKNAHLQSSLLLARRRHSSQRPKAARQTR